MATGLVRAKILEEKTIEGVEYVLLEIKGETLAGETGPVQFSLRKSKVAVDDAEDITTEVINLLDNISDEIGVTHKPAEGEVVSEEI